ncbi:hypothetical protein HU200_039915 [Digitaria exilis]|uniref:F-box domain-containing protein n=1 Tax=Digitaria exilis TaxID=1010633 RepID=A0A835EH79_9POAL|nr:hypothetical protein HU200_039915 [Digitaria exilis]
MLFPTPPLFPLPPCLRRRQAWRPLLRRRRGAPPCHCWPGRSRPTQGNSSKPSSGVSRVSRIQIVGNVACVLGPFLTGSLPGDFARVWSRARPMEANEDILVLLLERVTSHVALVRAAVGCRRWRRAVADAAFLRRFRSLHGPPFATFYPLEGRGWASVLSRVAADGGSPPLLPRFPPRRRGALAYQGQQGKPPPDG